MSVPQDNTIHPVPAPEFTALEEPERPYRAGVFNTVDQAKRAVDALLEAGFTTQHITVVCSDEMKEQHFERFENVKPAGTNTPANAAIGSAVGATIGGLGTAAAGFATGMDPVILSAPGIWGGGVFGGFLGAMITRGEENELADFYEQAVMRGQILVAAEAHGPDAEIDLARASAVLEHCGADPLPLKEG
jgi:outer membrane lipoprotein SlyB